MKTTLALLMAAAITIGGFQAANAQNAPLNGYASNGSFLGNLLNGAGFNGYNNGYPYAAGANYNGYNPYLNAGYGNNGYNGAYAGNGGACHRKHRKKNAIRKMQRRMQRQAMQNQYGGGYGGYGNGWNNGYQNAGNGRWGF